MTTMSINRRTALCTLAAAALGSVAPTAIAAAPGMTVYKDPSCGCCGLWAKHVERAGFAVTLEDVADLDAIKARFGVPEALQSCHTAIVAGYVVEGHVPAGAVMRLLKERPDARGLAVPGMPIGSPGMEGHPVETYDVILFGPGGQKVFARYRGPREL